MKNLNIIFLFLTSILSIRVSYADFNETDTAIVNVRSMDTTDFPVQLICSNSDTTMFVKGKHVAKGVYRFFVPVKNYERAEILIQSPFSILINKAGFIPQPRPVILLGGGKEVDVLADFKNQLNIKVHSEDPEINLFETYAQQKRKFDELSWKRIQERSVDGITEEKKMKIAKDMDDIRNKLYKVKLKFVKNNWKSFAALVVFESYYQQLGTQDALSRLNSIAPDYHRSFLWISLFKKLTAAANTNTGSMISAFSGKDISGSVFNSDQLKGKYYLIDFWGSWCGPCRQSNPKLKKIYEEYHSKGFEIVGIAYESGTKEAQQHAWRKAVADDGLLWINLLNSLDNNLVKKFGITSYPTKLLVNPEGKIILRVSGNTGQIEQQLMRAFK